MHTLYLLYFNVQIMSPLKIYLSHLEFLNYCNERQHRYLTILMVELLQIQPYDGIIIIYFILGQINIMLFNYHPQGKTTVAVVMPYASLSCDVVCIILTLKSSCSYLKATHYVLPYKLSPSDWLSPENTFGYNNSEISKYLKVLPVRILKNFQNALERGKQRCSNMVSGHHCFRDGPNKEPGIKVWH